MKKLKQIIQDVKTLIAEPASDELNSMLWQLICYPPKMPLRLHQEQLFAEAEMFSVTVNDPYFTHQQLSIKGFKWGNGRHKVLITHGWGSKAADFAEMITALKETPDLQIITFDAPANGSSDGDLSNLLLFVNAAKAVIAEAGTPDIVIGHSFGAMANVLALTQLSITPTLLISITPFILLKENFVKSMTAVGVPPEAQERFLQDFYDRYDVPASYYNMNDLYTFNGQLNHWLAYDEQDIMLPYEYLEHFLAAHPSIKTKSYNGAGHERIIKSAELIGDVVEMVNEVL
jgi:pimeloyl-ACP methyl ester carboxylesterase